MFLGRYQLGEVVPIAVLCRNRAQAKVRPDAAPLVCIYRLGSSATLACALYASITDRAAAVSLFRLALWLDATRFPLAGHYLAVITYTSEGADQAEERHFEIVANGDELGVVTGLHAWDRPEADYLLMMTEGGSLRQGRNPS